MDAVMTAGGPTKGANMRDIFLVRQVDGKGVVERINFKELVGHANFSNAWPQRGRWVNRFGRGGCRHTGAVGWAYHDGVRRSAGGGKALRLVADRPPGGIDPHLARAAGGNRHRCAGLQDAGAGGNPGGKSPFYRLD